jgi:hypothetical protein
MIALMEHRHFSDGGEKEACGPLADQWLGNDS